MSPREIAEALCSESGACTLCSLHRVCNMVDPDLMPKEMDDENIKKMLNALFGAKNTAPYIDA